MEVVTMEQVLVALYKARGAKREAKESVKKYSAEHELCEYYDKENAPCYRSCRDKENWCDTCKARHTIWKVYQKASYKSGVLLKTALWIGKKLSE